jgi:hypothetical protein
MTVIPLADQIKCVERELKMRKGAYPRWVHDGRISQEHADTEIARMQAVLETLKKLSPPPAQKEMDLA